jgi:hypothetical protein
LRIFAKNFGVKRYGRSWRPVFCFSVKIFFAASSMRYRIFSEQVPIRALDARWIFAALPRVRARLAELRAARFATHSQSSNNSKLANDARGRTGA